MFVPNSLDHKDVGLAKERLTTTGRAKSDTTVAHVAPKTSTWIDAKYQMLIERTGHLEWLRKVTHSSWVIVLVKRWTGNYQMKCVVRVH